MAFWCAAYGLKEFVHFLEFSCFISGNTSSFIGIWIRYDNKWQYSGILEIPTTLPSWEICLLADVSLWSFNCYNSLKFSPSQVPATANSCWTWPNFTSIGPSPAIDPYLKYWTSCRNLGPLKWSVWLCYNGSTLSVSYGSVYIINDDAKGSYNTWKCHIERMNQIVCGFFHVLIVYSHHYFYFHLHLISSWSMLEI